MKTKLIAMKLMLLCGMFNLLIIKITLKRKNIN